MERSINMKIIIGTKNPAKIEAVKKIFTNNHYEFESINVASGVSEQPFSDEETIKGAINRAKQALILGKGQIGIGLEGGVEDTAFGLFLCNWGALVSENEKPLIAGGARILLPEEVADRLRKGEELGPVMDDFTKKKNIRKNEGAIGIFTNGIIPRADMFSHVTKLLFGQYQYRENITK
ncbi:MAG: NTPase [Bacillus sp. (in: firmicutes)]|nr:NTPase [Bacillus sp. (in: firmicutes)]